MQIHGGRNVDLHHLLYRTVLVVVSYSAYDILFCFPGRKKNLARNVSFTVECHAKLVLKIYILLNYKKEEKIEIASRY